jgi:SAM-dependent methyltransferase
MNDHNIDYSQMADNYDRLRTLSDEALTEWVEHIVDLSGVDQDGRLLDVGCGTGRFTIPLAERTDAAIYGLDPASEMLANALNKGGADRVHWVRGEGEGLPFNDDSLDCVFVSFTVQHLTDMKQAVDEAFRVLHSNGRLLIMTTSHEQFRRSPFHYFPELLQIDLDRFPSLPQLEQLLTDGGFSSVSSHSKTRSQRFHPVESYLKYVEEKPISTFALLPEEDFEKGLTKYERILREAFGNRVPYWEEYSFVVGEK